MSRSWVSILPSTTWGNGIGSSSSSLSTSMGSPLLHRSIITVVGHLQRGRRHEMMIAARKARAMAKTTKQRWWWWWGVVVPAVLLASIPIVLSAVEAPSKSHDPRWCPSDLIQRHQRADGGLTEHKGVWDKQRPRCPKRSKAVPGTDLRFCWTLSQLAVTRQGTWFRQLSSSGEKFQLKCKITVCLYLLI